MRVLVIIPTYNERENIQSLGEAVLAQDERIDLLIVDDGSPDGTGDLVDAMAAESSRVRVIHRAAKQGLARPTWPASGTRSPTATTASSKWTRITPTAR